MPSWNIHNKSIIPHATDRKPNPLTGVVSEKIAATVACEMLPVLIGTPPGSNPPVAEGYRIVKSAI
jgi:hypothetical protein